MTRFSLKPHPTSPASPIRRIYANVSHSPEGGLKLEFSAFGDIGRVKVAEKSAPTRRDGLWRSTCFEAFWAGPDGSYCEFNFAPSSEWASYAFDRFREGMRGLEMSPPDISLRVTAKRLILNVNMPPEATARFDPQGGARLGLSAVIEDSAGAKTYWAIVHPADKPDFHHPSGFIDIYGDSAR